MCRFLWVLFTHRVRNIRDGVTLAGSRLVDPRSERRFSLFLFPFWTDSSRCSHPLGRDCFRSHSRSVRRIFWSLLGWFRAFTVASPFRGEGWRWASAPVRPGGLFFCPSTVVIRDAVTLWVKCVGRFLLLHDRRLSLVLSPGSFRMGFKPLSGASLRTLWMPARFLMVLAATTSLREFPTFSSVLPFPASDTCLDYVPRFGGPLESLTHSIPRSFLVESLSAFAEGLTGAILLCPARALRLSLRWSHLLIPFADGIYHLRMVALAAGASLHALGSVGAHGVRGGSTYIALHRTWSVSAVLTSATWGSGRCLLLLLARLSASIHGDCLFSFTDLCVSQTKKSRGVVLFGHMT